MKRVNIFVEFSIKKATDKDIQIILELLYELERPHPINEKEIQDFEIKIRDYLSKPEKGIFVAKQNSKIVGLVNIILLERLNRVKLEMYIPELIVAKDFRHLGIGKKLIEYCAEIAKKNNCHRIRLESGNQRKDSHKFYERIGFEQTSLTFTKKINY